MSLFTFILEYDGGTYIKQIESDSPENASIIWAKSLEISSIKGLGPASKEAIIQEMKWADKSPVPIEGVKNVWFSSFLVRGELGCINIIKTVKK